MQWNYTYWELRECPGLAANREIAEAWFEENKSTLPIPRHQLQDVVVFQFGDERMRGDIRRIELAFHDGEFKWFNYIIYANGHGRSVHESKVV